MLKIVLHRKAERLGQQKPLLGEFHLFLFLHGRSVSQSSRSPIIWRPGRMYFLDPRWGGASPVSFAGFQFACGMVEASHDYHFPPWRKKRLGGAQLESSFQDTYNRHTYILNIRQRYVLPSRRRNNPATRPFAHERFYGKGMPDL